MKFTEVKIYANTMGTEALSGVTENAGISCCSVHDPADLQTILENKSIPVDYVEDELLQDKECWMSVYLAQNEQGNAQKEAVLKGVESLKEEFGDEFGSLRVEMREVDDEDWRDCWLKFFHPQDIGETFTVRPSWEECERPGRHIITIDPESSFGTGKHETTALCLKALESADLKGAQVLDMGCGSGILGIGALMSGAEYVTAVDIDENAAEIAKKNFVRNGCPFDRVYAGNILTDDKLKNEISDRKYKVITANIVADVIRAMLPFFYDVLTDDGVLICSGIIKPRSGEVMQSLSENGFELSAYDEQNDWVALTAVKANNR